MDHGAPGNANGSLARMLGLSGHGEAEAHGVLAGSAEINEEALIAHLRATGLGAEVDAILAKDATGGYADDERNGRRG